MLGFFETLFAGFGVGTLFGMWLTYVVVLRPLLRKLGKISDDSEGQKANRMLTHSETPHPETAVQAATNKEPVEVVVSSSRFPIWKTITIGTNLEEEFFELPPDKDYYDDRIVAIGRVEITVDSCARFLSWANGIYRTADEPTRVDLVLVTDEELGLPFGSCFVEVYDRAQRAGLALCLPEVGPQLRRQYLDQPNGETLLVAMIPVPIVSSRGYEDSAVFSVVNRSDRLLLTSKREKCRGESPPHQWVFCRHRQVT